MHSEISFHVPDLHCAACEAGVKQSLGTLGGIEGVNVDLETKTVRVAYDAGATTPAEIRQRIERAGFDVAS